MMADADENLLTPGHAKSAAKIIAAHAAAAQAESNGSV